MVSGAAVPPNIDPHEEAQIIAVESTDSLLPDPKLTDKIQADVALIRQQYDSVKNVRNQGRKLLGKVSVSNYTPKVLEKINKSQFGPASLQSADDKDNRATVIEFSKPYNPDVLSSELRKLGVTADPIWRSNGLDFGDIEYKSETDEYEFRQGLENCKPNCTENHFWVFHITNGKAEITGEHATDIPEERVQY